MNESKPVRKSDASFFHRASHGFYKTRSRYGSKLRILNLPGPIVVHRWPRRPWIQWVAKPPHLVLVVRINDDGDNQWNNDLQRDDCCWRNRSKWNEWMKESGSLVKLSLVVVQCGRQSERESVSWICQKDLFMGWEGEIFRNFPLKNHHQRMCHFHYSNGWWFRMSSTVDFEWNELTIV